MSTDSQPAPPGTQAARTPAQPLECGDLSPAFPERSQTLALFKKPWPHAPVHKLSENGVYFVTGATLYKERLFHDTPRLDLLEFKLLTLANRYKWCSAAWFERVATPAMVQTICSFKTDEVQVEADF